MVKLVSYDVKPWSFSAKTSSPTHSLSMQSLGLAASLLSILLNASDYIFSMNCFACWSICAIYQTNSKVISILKKYLQKHYVTVPKEQFTLRIHNKQNDNTTTLINLQLHVYLCVQVNALFTENICENDMK